MKRKQYQRNCFVYSDDAGIKLKLYSGLNLNPNRGHQQPTRFVRIFSQAERLGLKQQHFVKMCLCKHGEETGEKGKQRFQTQFEKINSK